MNRRSRHRGIRGFTLVEMVVAITVSAIVVVFASMFLAAPVESYFAQTRRERLVEASELISRSISKDVRAALPYSVRTRVNGNFRLLDMLVVDAPPAVYQDTGAAPDVLTVSPGSDTDFSINGRFQPNLTGGFIDLAGRRIAVSVGPNIYTAPNLITPPQIVRVSYNQPSSERIHLASSFSFSGADLTHRVFLVRGTVGYLCDQTAGTLRRYEGYPLSSSATAHDTTTEMNALASTSDLISSKIASCNFSAPAGTTSGARELAGVRITLRDGGESISILEQSSLEWLR
ncbi:MAG TPA: prepilin-type N-terminal cleavage/methylation domain-containing protein [Steroidobacteraceae bacterium]|nr:prepilin-type N-terminal cleavage/methylation domain-containing protein [Steroidobacteraceae bacterium]